MMKIKLWAFAIAITVLWTGCKPTHSEATPPDTFQNPILSGFHPDPSICRVGDDYYLVTSSFEWFPGVPIYHSTDLVNWQQIGNVLSRPEQLMLEPGHRHNGGIWAPTIRYHEGTFYMITTVAGKGNFYVTATNPAGPWSDPVWITRRGIDPSLFWDDDGRCWYTGAANLNNGPQWPNQNGVYIQELDLEQQKLIGQPLQLTHGHATNARWTEGPHIYKIDGKYLLLVAEGGTGVAHCVTVFKSDSVTGPYIPSHTNPVLTHRHLGKNNPIGMLGHADIVQTQNGEWWAVLLGRRVNENLSMLARETFLVKVEFEDGWPLFNPGIGKVLAEDKRPNLPWHPFSKPPARDEFEGDSLAFYWNFLRTPMSNWYQLAQGELKITPRPHRLTGMENPSMIVRRVQHHYYKATTSFVRPASDITDEVGVTAFLDNKNHYRLCIKDREVCLIKVSEGNETIVASVPFDANEVVLQIEASMFDFNFRFGASENSLSSISETQDARVITAKTFIGDGFNGPYVGMYAISDDENEPGPVNFKWFEYEPVGH